jgi:hypothetical protein
MQSISVAITLLKSGPISGDAFQEFFLVALALPNHSIQFFNLLLQQLCHLQILLQQRLILFARQLHLFEPSLYLSDALASRSHPKPLSFQ